MSIRRDLEQTVRAHFAERPAILLTGSRQAGKTWLLRDAFPEAKYLNLDLPSLAEEAETAGEQFLRKHPPPLVLDEVQYAPALFRPLKHTIDADRETNARYLLTGSQKFALMEAVSESLAGRVAIFELHSLSLREIEAWMGRPLDHDDLVHRLYTGGYPELVAKSLPPSRYYADLVATYLERDVRQAINVRSLRDFDRFLRLAALRTGQLLNLNALASEVGVSAPTLKAWLSVLEASNVVYLLPPYFGNLGKRLVKAPKLYFLDTGLTCFLAGFESAAAVVNSSMLGALFETQVLGQLVRYFHHAGRRANVYFIRDQHGSEVDFVVPVGEAMHVLECKWAEMPARPKAFDDVTRQVGEARVLSRTVITPMRGLRRRGDYDVGDPVDFPMLDVTCPGS